MLSMADLSGLDPYTWTDQRVLALARPIDQVDVIRADAHLDQALQSMRHQGGEALVVDETGRTVGTFGPTELQHGALIARFDEQPQAPGVSHQGGPAR